jgi:hypothetical protein
MHEFQSEPCYKYSLSRSTFSRLSFIGRYAVTEISVPGILCPFLVQYLSSQESADLGVKKVKGTWFW